MYLPKHFEQNDVDVLHALMRQRPLATLVTLSSDGLEANHIPLYLSAKPGAFGTLSGHVARANPLWKDMKGGGEVLAVFHGPDAYITPGWYPSKAETGKAVPTWNYAVVHAHGVLRVIDDTDWLRASLTRQVDAAEAPFAHPWGLDDAPADYIDNMLKAIVGIEIDISRLVGKWKVSQNQPAVNRNGVMDGLRQSGSVAANEMAVLVEHAAPKL